MAKKVKAYPAGQLCKFYVTFDKRETPPLMDYVVHVTGVDETRTRVSLSCWDLSGGDHLWKVKYSMGDGDQDWWTEVLKVQITKDKALMLRNLHKA